MRRPVYTFAFARYQTVAHILEQKLDRALAAGAVVITSPRDCKAFILKFVELLHVLDQNELLMRSMRLTTRWKDGAGWA